MYNTYKMFLQYIPEEYKEVSIEKLVSLYKSTTDNSKILSLVYVKLFNLLLVLRNKYVNSLDEADITSYTLEVLDYCLSNYKPDYGVKFSTYLYNILSNKLYEKIRNCNCKKRKVETCNFEDLIDYGVYDMYNFISVDLPNNLTYNEKVYCELASKGYDNSYITLKLNCSRMNICKIRKSLKIKLFGLQS